MNILESQNFEPLEEAERIAVLYAPRTLRPRYRTLLIFDAQLSRIALTAREPMLAQLKLAWWRDVCAKPAGAHGHPLGQWLASYDAGERAQLARLVDGWEAVAVGEQDWLRAAEAVASARAGAFAVAARVEPSDACRAAAQRWTLVTLARHSSDEEQRDAVLAAARQIGQVTLPRALRPLALLDGLARRALRRDGYALLGDRLSPLAALRLGIFGR